MLQQLYMAPWIPVFDSSVAAQIGSEDRDAPFILFQLATVDGLGCPRVRTLVFRGYLFDNKTTNVITFVTDKRMSKYEELHRNDAFEAVFWFGKTRKQFRLRGRARIISDTYQPVLDLSSIQPKTLIDNIRTSSGNDSDNDDNDNVVVVEAAVPAKLTGKNGIAPPTQPPTNPQNIPLSHPILSSSVQSQIQSQIQAKPNAAGVSYTNLHDLSAFEYFPPTKEEWDNEVKRLWDNLSKNMKKSFRKPAPKTPMNESNQKLIDSLSRGVDGKKDEDGLKNFAVVGLFVDYVDLYETEKDRRYIYEKDSHQQWVETEVCP